MIRIPYIKIPSVRVGGIDPTSDIGTGGATPAPPTPITYLTRWKIVGNSEVHGNEIWSCGEYNSTDGKYHILVQPQGGSVADIALDAPLRKVNDVADTIEFEDGTATVTRNLASADIGSFTWIVSQIGTTGYYRMLSADVYETIKVAGSASSVANILTPIYTAITPNQIYSRYKGIAVMTNGNILVYDENYNQSDSAAAFKTAIDGVELIYELATPTTELVDAPQIEEADSYSMAISQGAKAVEWSSFSTYSE